MKLKISESKIRQIVEAEVVKTKLNKIYKEQKWPSYSAYLLAEIISHEWQSKLNEGDENSTPSTEWIAEYSAQFNLPAQDIQEAAELVQSGEINEGFFKAVAKPWKNIYQVFSNITQHAANLTDPDYEKKNPEGAQAAKVADKIDDQLPGGEIPAPEEMAKEDPDEVAALLRQILDLLAKADDKMNLDAIKPGMEDLVDQSADAIEQGVEAAPEAGGEEEAAEAPSVAVFKGKGGKGLQSFLARGKLGIPGKVHGAILKHVAKSLKAQGVTVTESVMDDVQGWIWHGLVEDAYRAQYGEEALINELKGNPEDFGGGGQSLGGGRTADGADEGGKAEGGVEPVMQIYKGKKGVGLQSWLDLNREKLGIDDETVKLLLMIVQDWAKENKLKVERMKHTVLGKIIPEILNKHRVRKLQETINKLR